MNHLVLFGGLMVATTMVTGCDRKLMERTEVGRMAFSDNREPAEERFRNAIFSFVEGQTRAEAVDILTADGANCVEAVCVWKYEYRMGFRDLVGFGPGYPGCSWTSNEHVCTARSSYQAVLGAPIINERFQISTTVRHEIIHHGSID